MDKLEHAYDALAVAAQLGRLDLVTTLLAAIAVVMAVQIVTIEMRAQRTVKKVTEKELEKAMPEFEAIATATAERVANEHVQRELPAILEATMDTIRPDIANEIADNA